MLDVRTAVDEDGHVAREFGQQYVLLAQQKSVKSCRSVAIAWGVAKMPWDEIVDRIELALEGVAVVAAIDQEANVAALEIA